MHPSLLLPANDCYFSPVSIDDVNVICYFSIIAVLYCGLFVTPGNRKSVNTIAIYFFH